MNKNKKFSTYLKDHVGTLAEHVIIRRVNWRLFGELAVKLTHIILTTLMHTERKKEQLIDLMVQSKTISKCYNKHLFQ